MRNWLRYFAFWRRNPRLDARDEITFHLEMRERDLIARGMSPEEARGVAAREFGDPQSVAHQVERIDSRIIAREERAEAWADLRRDVRVGFRSLRHSPAFTVTAVLCSALGIGVTATIVSAAYSILVRPLPYPNADELVTIYGENTVKGYTRSNMSIPDFLSWKEQNRTFESMGMWTWYTATLSDAGQEAERYGGGRVTANLFRLFGVQPALGRLFAEGDDVYGGPRLALISHNLWQNRYSGDSSIVGRSILVNGIPTAVIGVMQPGFNFPDRGDIWMPMAVNPATLDRGNRSNPNAFGRLKQGVTIEQARADLNRIDANLQKEFNNSNHGWRAELVPLREDLVGDLRQPLRVFLWAVALLLLMVCANVASLNLARGATRARELAVRTALGASRNRLFRQLITESLIVALIGGALGVLIAWQGMYLLRFAFPGEAPPFFINLRLDGATLLIVVATAMLTGLLFGVVPALRGTSVDLNVSLRDGTRGSGDGVSRSRIRSSLVLVEVALSVMLMIGAMLLVRSYRNFMDTDMGFDQAGVLTARITLPSADYPTLAASEGFYNRLFERMRVHPGVAVIGAAGGIPFSGWNLQSALNVEGRPAPRQGEEFVTHFQSVTPDFFKAIGVPLIKGRWLQPTDNDSLAPVALVNEELVKRLYPNEDPIGKRVNFGWMGKGWFTIVGVIGTYRHYRLPNPMGPAMYFTSATWGPLQQTVTIRGKQDDANALVPVLRSAVREIDPKVALYDVQTMEEAVDRSLWRQRLQGSVLGVFAALALVLACFGLYGVISYAVAQRTRELGVRIALGATRRDVMLMVFGQSGRLVIGGIALGLVGAWFGVRLLETMLYGVEAKNLMVFASVPILLAVVALLSSVIPARRASRVDPIIAMRAE
jgi:putative ABC transport system permease protein